MNHLEVIKTELQKVNVNDIVIDQITKQYAGLTIADKDDKDGILLVHSARLDVRAMRLKIEDKRVELKADSLAYGKLVDTEAKRLTALLEPTEARLQAEEDRIKAEKDREKREKEEKVRLLVEERTKAVAATGAAFDGVKTWTLRDLKVSTGEIETYTADGFRDRLALFQEIAKIEAEKKAKEDEERQRVAKEQEAERARLESIRLEQAKKEEELRAAQAKIDEANRAAREKEERDAMMAKAQQEKDEAVARAKEEATKAEAARQAEIARKEEARRIVEAEEAKRLAELAPDKEKLLAYIAALYKVDPPEIKGKKVNMIFGEFVQNFSMFEEKVKALK